MRLTLPVAAQSQSRLIYRQKPHDSRVNRGEPGVETEHQGRRRQRFKLREANAAAAGKPHK